MGLYMNSDYVIIDSVDISDVGIALGRSLEYPENWVTWMYNQREPDKRNYFWGHYTSNTLNAKIDFQERILRETGNELEVNRDKPDVRSKHNTAKAKLKQLQAFKQDPLFPFACKIALWKCRMDKAYFQRDLEETILASMAEPAFLKNEYQFFRDLRARIPGFLGEELQGIVDRLYGYMVALDLDPKSIATEKCGLENDALQKVQKPKTKKERNEPER